MENRDARLLPLVRPSNTAKKRAGHDTIPGRAAEHSNSIPIHSNPIPILLSSTDGRPAIFLSNSLVPEVMLYCPWMGWRLLMVPATIDISSPYWKILSICTMYTYLGTSHISYLNPQSSIFSLQSSLSLNTCKCLPQASIGSCTSAAHSIEFIKYAHPTCLIRSIYFRINLITLYKLID